MSRANEPLILYSTAACHLCERAESLLEQLRRRRPGLCWEVVDIAGDERLFERYGVLIPVLALPDGSELRWPFGDREILAALARAGALCGGAGDG